MIDLAEKRKRDTARKQAQRAIPAVVCERCGRTGCRLDRHHRDHDKPLEVEILCQSCHGKADKEDGFRRAIQPASCAICGVEFMPAKSSRAVICGSAKCKAETGRKSADNRWAGRPTTRPCAYCGEEFQIQRPRQTTCGRTCGNKLAWQRRATACDSAETELSQTKQQQPSESCVGD